MELKERIFLSHSPEDFGLIALEVFRFQYENNIVYREFCNYLLKKPYTDISHLNEIPFLPVELFKSKKVVSSLQPEEALFTSSSTTGTGESKHYVCDLNMYNQSFTRSFELFYGSMEKYTVFALLPAYLERKGSSLVYMASRMINNSLDKESGFYLYNYEELAEKLKEKDKYGKVVLLGVTFALLDMVEKYSLQLKNTIIMETGGMKGRRKELTREELHQTLCNGFGVSEVHSEYGMTELLSQAYSKGNGIYHCPPWMKILLRDTQDPLSLPKGNRSGIINVIDLANLYSCSFIATQDLGKVHGYGFEVLGRTDRSDIRGCNLMVL